MVKGYPDWHRAVDIAAQTIPHVDTDIVAQTVSKLAVDIAAQSLSQVAVDIASQTVPKLAVDIAAQTIDKLNVDVAAQTISKLAVDIVAQSLPQVAVDVAAQTISKLAVDIAAQSLPQVAIDVAAQTVSKLAVDIVAQSLPQVAVDVAAQTVSKLAVDIVAQSLPQVAVDIAAQTVSKLAVDIAAQSLPQVAVNIAAQTIANLAVDIAAQTIDKLNIDITAQSLPSLLSNIKTADGINIIIDKLTQAAYHSRAETFYPGGQTGDPTLFRDADNFGIYYRRGCRGHLDRLEIYLKNTTTVDKTVNFALKENPDGGIILDNIAVTQSPGVTGWVQVDVRRFWPYDSLFIYNKDPYSPDLQVGYWDTGEPDGFWMYATERWAYNWQRMAYRIWITALSVGDLPVSGTVSSVLLPSSSLGSRSESVVVGPKATATLIDFYGQGRNHLILLWSRIEKMEFSIFIDENEVYLVPFGPISPYNLYIYFSAPGQGIGLQVTKYDTAGNNFAIMITTPLEFKYRLKINAYNPEDLSYIAAAAVNYIKPA